VGALLPLNSGWQGPPENTASTNYASGFIWSTYHIIRLSWVVEIADEFEPEFDGLHEVGTGIRARKYPWL
jgi:hypothetical protein